MLEKNCWVSWQLEKSDNLLNRNKSKYKIADVFKVFWAVALLLQSLSVFLMAHMSESELWVASGV